MKAEPGREREASLREARDGGGVWQLSLCRVLLCTVVPLE